MISLIGFTVLGIIHGSHNKNRSKRAYSARAKFSYSFPRRLYTSATARLDIINTLPTTLLIRPLLSVMTTMITVYGGAELSSIISSRLNDMHSGRLFQIQAPGLFILISECILIMLGSDFGLYVCHRLAHENPFFWRIHRVHHSAETLNFFTRDRDHPLEMGALAASRVLGGAVFLGFGMFILGWNFDPQSAVLATTYRIWFDGFYRGHNHSHIPISFGKALDILIAGPVLHQIHHSAEPHMMNKNYGFGTHLYDWLFGTLYLPRKGETYRIGLNENEIGSRNPHLSAQSFYIKPIQEMIDLITIHPRRTRGRY